jgi:hypothetical protein
MKRMNGQDSTAGSKLLQRILSHANDYFSLIASYVHKVPVGLSLSSCSLF